MLRLTTFGGLHTFLDDQVVKGFVSRKAEALLIYLAMNPREHPRETLSELLWDDLPQDLALSYLRTTLASLHKQLSAYLSTTRHTISINTESNYHVDALQLDEVLERARAQWEAKTSFTQSMTTDLQEALTLYKGTFLEGFYPRNCREFEGWMTQEQERVRSRVLDAYFHLGQHYLDRRSFSSGITYTGLALQLDPLWEEAHRQMMTLLALSGQRSAALAQYETCRQLLKDELDVVPDEKTDILYEEILAGKLLAEKPKKRTTTLLPVIGTMFIDRPTEIRAIMSQLEKPDCRLLTLIGHGGIGKTRLALEIARQLMDEYTDGVHFISFTGVREPRHIFETIANMLGIDFGGDFSSEDNLIQYLRKKQMLLVLDNFETVVANAEVLSRILGRCAGVKFLVTSRERLNLVEEWLYFVDMLPIPESEATPDAARYGAVALFTQSAQRVQPHFSVMRELPHVLRICRAVGGLPLAIELAASWVHILSCEQIANEVENGLQLLATTARNIPERHRSIQIVFESSWKLLSDDEQRILCRLSVFRGGFNREAAEAVAGASLLVLSSLVNKSLLRSVDHRYEIHELLRQYAKERLLESPDENDAVQHSHSAYFARFISLYEDRLARTQPGGKFDVVIREIENIRLAWQYALDRGDAEAIRLFLRPLYQVYDAQNNYKDAEAIFSGALSVLEHLDDPCAVEAAAHAQLYRGICNFRMDRYETAETLLQAALPVLESHNASKQLALLILGRNAAARGLYRQARDYWTQAAALLRASDDNSGLANVLLRLSSGAMMMGDYRGAEAYLDEGLAVLRGKEDWSVRLFSLVIRGDLHVRLGRFDEAKTAFNDALKLSELLESRNNQAMILADMAQALIAQGDYGGAQAVCQQSIELNRELHNRWGQSYGLLYLGRAYYGLGNGTAASECYRAGIDICEASGIQTTLVSLLRHGARLCLQNGELDSAQHRLGRALQIAQTTQILPLLLDTLVGLAEVDEGRGQGQIAAVVACSVVDHPAAMFETRQDAQRLLERVGATTPLTGITAGDIDSLVRHYSPLGLL